MPFHAAMKLFEAQMFLDTWVHAVVLQRQRLGHHQRPELGEDRALLTRQLADWLLTCSADALLFVLALDQVADAAVAVRRAASPETADAIQAATAQFDKDCPDRRAARNAITHVSDYLHGDGRGKTGRVTGGFAYPEFPEAFVLVVAEGGIDRLLEIDLDGGVNAARQLQASVSSALRGVGQG